MKKECNFLRTRTQNVQWIGEMKEKAPRCRNEGFFKTAFDGANLNILEKRQGIFVLRSQ